jgi:hypothetical protein
LKYGGADFLQNPWIFSLQNGPRMRAIESKTVLTFQTYTYIEILIAFEELFAIDNETIIIIHLKRLFSDIQ